MSADELDKIGASLDSGSFDGALISALALWRRTRDCDVADLVDAMATRLPPSKVPELPRSPKDAVQEAWMKLATKAKSRPDAQVFAHSALLSSLYRAVPIQERARPYNDNASKSRLQAWRARLGALAALDDDPRITSALIAFLRDVPFEMGDPYTGRWLYDPAIELCERLADRRAVPALQSLIDSPPAKTLNLRDHLLKRLPLAIDTIEETAKRFEAVSESLDRARVKALADRLGVARDRRTPSTATSTSEISESDLIHQIVTAATPEDAAAAHAVLIDSWLERGDPRGELATTTDERRVRAIVRAHDKEWVGPDLARVLELRTYRGGLLDSARLASTSAANAAGWAKAARAPQLATLRVLHKGNANEQVFTQFLTSPTMLSIHEVTATSLAMLKALSARETSLRLETLTLEGIGLSGGDALAVLNSANFARLKKIRLVVKRPNALPQLAIDVGRSLTQQTRDRHDLVVARLHGVKDPESIGQWLAHARDVSPLAMGVELAWHPDSIDFVMRADPTTKKLSLEVRTWGTAPFINVLASLRDVEHLTITAKGDKPLSSPGKLAAAIEATGVKSTNVDLPPSWKASGRAKTVSRRSR